MTCNFNWQFKLNLSSSEQVEVKNPWSFSTDAKIQLAFSAPVFSPLPVVKDKNSERPWWSALSMNVYNSSNALSESEVLISGGFRGPFTNPAVISSSLWTKNFSNLAGVFSIWLIILREVSQWRAC